MKTQNKQVKVLLPLALPEAFIYSVPDAMDVRIGSFVDVPLGSKTRKGVVWGHVEKFNDSPRIKEITAVYDIPPMPQNLIDFINWVANYTISNAGNVLKMALSVPIEPEKQVAAYCIVHHPDRAFQVNYKPTKSRTKLVEYLAKQEFPKTSKQIKEAINVGAPVIKAMAKTGSISEVMIIPPSENVERKQCESIELSDHQQIAADDLIEKLKADKFSVTMLDGVTGSGKTEVYFAAIEEIFKEGGQVLVLLPEIALTSQFISRFDNRFGFKPAGWHSGVTKATKKKIWKDVLNGNENLVVGARSALFLPFNNLKLIILDEEHDPSYKQEDGVIYHARDMAIVRSKIENIPIVLSSATPSLETIYNVQSGKYDRLHLPSRHGGASFPDIEIVDMRQYKLSSGKWISPPLLEAMKENLKKNKQSLLFLNRKGFAPYVFCGDCGHKFKCGNCTSWLVEHKRPHRLLCHHCGSNFAFPQKCTECNKDNTIISYGIGVERLADEVRENFPDANIALMTGDGSSDISEIKQVISNIEKGLVDIIIGTQIIAKGHHFPKLTLVGVIDADLGLSGGDLRAGEKTYQLLHQVAGRSGREKDKGRVLLQTLSPQNNILSALTRGDRDAYYNFELQNRESVNMPPFSKFVSFIISGTDKDQAYKFAREVAKLAPDNDNIQLFGPIPAPMFLLRGSYRYRFLVKAKKNVNVQKWVEGVYSSVKIPANIKFKADVDPYSFF